MKAPTFRDAAVRRSPSPRDEEYRRRVFAAFDLADVAAIAAGLRRAEAASAAQAGLRRLALTRTEKPPVTQEGRDGCS